MAIFLYTSIEEVEMVLWIVVKGYERGRDTHFPFLTPCNHSSTCFARFGGGVGGGAHEAEESFQRVGHRGVEWFMV